MTEVHLASECTSTMVCTHFSAGPAESVHVRIRAQTLEQRTEAFTVRLGEGRGGAGAEAESARYDEAHLD